MAVELVPVKFLKQWRGHDKGAEAALTPERAKELIRGKFCKELKVQEDEPAKPEPAKRLFKRPEVEAKQEATGTEP